MLLSTVLPPQEGIGHYCWNLAQFLVRQGHRVDLITRGSAHAIAPQRLGEITIWRPPFITVYPLHVHLHGLFVNRLVRRLEGEVDMFHLHSPLVPVIRTRRPLLMTAHSSVRHDVICTPVNSFYTALMKLQGPFSAGLELALLRRANAVNADAPHVAQQLGDAPGAPRNILVSGNAIDDAIFNPPPDSQARERMLLCAGRLSPGKGVEELLSAAAVVMQHDTSLRMVVAGDGPLRSALEQQALREGIAERVIFIGQVSDRQELAALYRRAMLFVLPSHHEGLPTVLLEAMACGCPVIATAVGGIPGVVHHAENGLLVPPRQAEILADAILQALADPAALERFSQNGLKTIRDGYTWEKLGAAYLKEYARLIDSFPVPARRW
jgi:glycosyltransferase involved in cell wall biosynthesis